MAPIGSAATRRTSRGGERVPRNDVVDAHMLDRAPWHRGIQGIVGILHDGGPAELLDGAQAGGAVIEIAGEHDADRPRTVDLCGSPEERVDGGAEAISLGPLLITTLPGSSRRW
jgi:hypothetical protein